MCKKAINIGLITTVFVVLSGCSAKTDKVNTEVVTPLHEITKEIEWNDITLEALTPVCSYEIEDEVLYIFPYNDNDFHITVKEIFISDNGFWKTVLKSTKKKNKVKKDKYSIVTNEKGETIGFLEKDKNSAYLVQTSELPSSYVLYVLDYLCNIDI